MIHEPETDTCIMGAGAAGALFAARLSTAGRAVTVLDAGPGWTPGDLVSSAVWARRLKWGGAPVDAGGADRVGHNYNQGWGLGGSAIHHYASYPRLHEADFTLSSDHGVGRDWPFAYETLRSHYDAIQAEIGISGDAAAERWRPPGALYPLPPLPVFAQGRILADGFAKLGMHVAPQPMAILSREYKGRAACLNDGWCDAGCPIGALHNPLVLHLPAAEAAAARIVPNATVTAIETDARGRATALLWRDTKGEAHRQGARTFILAGASVQNARLLLANPSPAHPEGFGNRSRAVGRWFNAHSVGNAYGLFAAETEGWRGVNAGVQFCQDDYGKRAAEGFGALSWGLAPSVKPNDLIGIVMTRPDLFGASLAAFMRRAAHHLGMIVAMVEGVPAAENRIELTADRDTHGVPRARVIHTRDVRTGVRFAAAMRQGEAIVRAAGADEVWTTPAPAFGHMMGGTIMGTDPATSVTDAFGRLHEAENVLVAGGGLFPSIGAVSPTFTILALADRTAARMIAEPAFARL